MRNLTKTYRHFLSLLLVIFTGCAPSSVEDEKMLRLAQSLRDQGNFAAAASIYQQALADTQMLHSPASRRVPLLLSLAQTYEEQGDFSQAEASYLTAVREDTAPISKKGLARCYILQDKLTEALSLYKDILTQHKADAVTYNGLGVVYGKMGHHDLATSAFKKAYDLSPETMDYRSNLALSLALSGEPEKGLKLIEAVASPVYAPEKLKHNLRKINEILHKKTYKSAQGDCS